MSDKTIPERIKNQYEEHVGRTYILHVPHKPVKVREHPWFKRIVELMPTLGPKEHELYELELAKEMRRGNDPQTAAVMAYGAVKFSMDGPKAGKHLVEEVAKQKKEYRDWAQEAYG